MIQISNSASGKFRKPNAKILRTINFWILDFGIDLAFRFLHLDLFIFMRTNFEIIARAIIIYKSQILLCQTKGNNWYYLPGGHVEYGEQCETALVRELQEEFGANAEILDFCGAVENIFHNSLGEHHELNLVFEVKIDKYDIKPLETHLCFIWKDLSLIESEYILPKTLKESLLMWLKDRNIFWASESVR